MLLIFRKLNISKITFIITLFILYFNDCFGQGVGINIVSRGKTCRPMGIWVKNTTTTSNVIRFIYQWGDGTTDIFPPSNAGDTVYHKYDSLQVGYKTIVLISESKDGISTANTSFIIYSTDNANILANGVTCNGNASFSDISTLNGSPDSTRRFTWNFGDGSPLAYDSSVSHTYPLVDAT